MIMIEGTFHCECQFIYEVFWKLLTLPGDKKCVCVQLKDFLKDYLKTRAPPSKASFEFIWFVMGLSFLTFGLILLVLGYYCFLPRLYLCLGDTP